MLDALHAAPSLERPAERSGATRARGQGREAQRSAAKRAEGPNLARAVSPVVAAPQRLDAVPDGATIGGPAAAHIHQRERPRPNKPGPGN